MQNPYGDCIDGQPVQEVDGPVQGIEHPQEVGGDGIFFIGILLSKDAMIGEAGVNLYLQELLAVLVGGGDRVQLLILVLELDIEGTPEALP